MRLEEITPSNRAFLDLVGNEKLAIGSAYFEMLNLFDACKAGTVHKSIWIDNFERFNAGINGAYEILDRMPDTTDPFVRNLKSVIESYQHDVYKLNKKLIKP